MIEGDSLPPRETADGGIMPLVEPPPWRKPSRGYCTSFPAQFSSRDTKCGWKGRTHD
jgi:hypothetical protein